MTVPFSEAVASSVPVLFSASADRGDLCARISCVVVRVLVENSTTSPVGVGGEAADAGTASAAEARGAGVGSGDG